MQVMANRIQRLIFAAGILLLTLSFSLNFFHVSTESWFSDYQWDSEELVLCRLMESQQYGVFSDFGMLCRYAYDEKMHGTFEAVTDYQHFNNDIAYQYGRYTSQIGGQGMLFSLMAKASPFSNAGTLWLLYSFNSVSLALLFMIMVFWFKNEFNLFVGIIVFASIFLAPWITIMARNLYWVLWTMYLPMTICLCALNYEDRGKLYRTYVVNGLIFFTVLLRCSAGYEFISTILVAMTVPYFYYAISRQWAYQKLAVRLFMVGLSGVAGFVTAILIHAWQRGMGSLEDGLASILFDVGRRTYGEASSYPKVFSESLNASVFDVLAKYLFSFSGVSLLCLVIATAIYFYTRRLVIGEIKLKALAISAWIALFAPLSWFILAKGHSYIHTHINFILWHIPMSIFTSAFSGYLGYLLFQFKKVKGIPSRKIMRMMGMVLFLAVALGVGENLKHMSEENSWYVKRQWEPAYLQLVTRNSSEYDIYIPEIFYNGEDKHTIILKARPIRNWVMLQKTNTFTTNTGGVFHVVNYSLNEADKSITIQLDQEMLDRPDRFIYKLK